MKALLALEDGRILLAGVLQDPGNQREKSCLIPA
jgi:hypothetical protein